MWKYKLKMDRCCNKTQWAENRNFCTQWHLTNVSCSPQCTFNRRLHYVNGMKTVQKLRPDPYPDTDDLFHPHLRNRPWLGEVSEEGTFNRAWQVLAPAERTVCRLQCIPSPFHAAPSADFIKVHSRTQFVLLNPILSIQLQMSETMTTNCCTASWKSTEPAASCCTQSCLHQTPLKLKCCWSYYTSRQMETMWRASNP